MQSPAAPRDNFALFVFLLSRQHTITFIHIRVAVLFPGIAFLVTSVTGEPSQLLAGFLVFFFFLFQIRIDLLKLFAKRYRDSNPGSKVKVIGYDPRPLIKIVPAASASDRRVKVFNFIEACKKLPANFTPEEVEPIVRRINPELHGRIRSLFVVLSDDMVKKRSDKSGTSAPPSVPASAPPASAEANTAESSSDEDESAQDVSDAPPTTSPPLAHTSRESESGSKGSKGSNGRSKSLKRGASSSLSSSAKK